MSPRQKGFRFTVTIFIGEQYAGWCYLQSRELEDAIEETHRLRREYITKFDLAPSAVKGDIHEELPRNPNGTFKALGCQKPAATCWSN
jgi:hypothetical protein